MSVFNSVLVTKGKGKLGDVVIGRWRSLKTLRGYTPHIKAAADQTKQLIYRNKMKIVSKLAAIIKMDLGRIWSIRHKFQTEFSAFTQAILRVMLQTYKLDITKLQHYTLGNGKLAFVTPITAAAAAGDTVTLTWVTALVPPGFPDTTATMDLFVINEDCTRAVIYPTPTLFSAGTVSVALSPDFVVGEKVFCMLGCQNEFTNPVTGNTYVEYSKFAGMVTAVFQTLIT